MTPADLLASSLLLSIVVAALGLGMMHGVERRLGDPTTREQAWGLVLYSAALPPLVVGLLLLLPPETRTTEAVVAPYGEGLIEFVVGEPKFLPKFSSLLQTHGSAGVLLLAALLCGVRSVLVVVRFVRLRALIDASVPAGAELLGVADEASRQLAVSLPAVRVSKADSDALLAGLLSPVLVLPASLAAAPESPSTRAVCAHELAHLKRGDHQTLWLEELLLSVLAINPLLGRIRDCRAAAREEACDALALTGADEALRRQYANSLLAALQNSASGRDAPALTFNSSKRKFVMNRLNAILAPTPRSGRFPGLVLTGVGALVAVVAGGGSLAVAAQREPVLAAPPTYVSVSVPTRPTVVVQPAANARPGFAPTSTAAPRREVRTVAPGPQPATAGQVAETPAPAVITNPGWAQPPIPRLPAGTLESSTNVRIRLTCTAEPDGGLSGCSAPAATPAEAGFAAAAIEAAQGARLSQATVEAAAPGAQVTFAVRFQMANPT